MRINQIGGLVIMIIVTLFFGAVAYIQRGYAQEAMMLAAEQEALAQENLKRAKKQEEIAIELAANARRVESEASRLRKQLEECKNQ